MVSNRLAIPTGAVQEAVDLAAGSIESSLDGRAILLVFRRQQVEDTLRS